MHPADPTVFCDPVHFTSACCYLTPSELWPFLEKMMEIRLSCGT